MTLMWNENNKTENEIKLIILIQKYNLDRNRNYCLNCFYIGTEFGCSLNRLNQCYKFDDVVSFDEMNEEKACFVKNPNPEYYYDAHFYLDERKIKITHNIKPNNKPKVLLNAKRKKRYSQLNDVYKCEHFSNFNAFNQIGCNISKKARDCYYRCPLDKPQCIKKDCIHFDNYDHECVECLHYFYKVYPKRKNKNNYKKSTIICEYCNSELLNNQENCPFCYKNINNKKEV